MNSTKNIFKGTYDLELIIKSLKSFSSIVVLIILSNVIYGQSEHTSLDSVDPNFDPNVRTSSFGPKRVSVILPLPDGKIIVGGIFNTYNRQPVGTLVRLNADGSLDPTFNMVLETITGNENLIRDGLLQSDGKILIIGNDFTVDGYSNLRHIIRLNPDGTLDPTFHYGSTLYPDTIAIDASDRLLVRASFGTTIVRLNLDGSIDSSFQFPSIFPRMSAFATQGNKIIVNHTSNAENASTLIRLNEDGTIDNTFSERTFGPTAVKILAQTDNKILILFRSAVIRLEENGADDDTFETIALIGGDGRDMALSIDGRITTVTFSPYTFRRFLANGAEDTSFTPYVFPNVFLLAFTALGLQTDGSMILGDTFNSTVNGGEVPNGFARIQSDGTPDPSFNFGGVGFQRQSPGFIREIMVQADDKILIGGDFDSINDVLRIRIARLNTDASIDESFQVEVSGADNAFSRMSKIYHIVEKPDGKLLVSGNFEYLVNGMQKANFVQLNPDGSIDNTFNLNVGIVDNFSCCNTGTNKPVLTAEDKIFVGTSRAIVASSIPIKLNSSGNLDTTFNSNIYPQNKLVGIWGIDVQPDGKVIIAGNRRGVGNPSKSYILRLNTDGSVDPTFQISEEDDRYFADLSILPDGKVLAVIGNAYSDVPTPQQSDVIRLHSDGTVDTSFDPGTSADGRINVILPLENGKMFVGGNFVSFDGQPRQNLAQLNEDGTVVPVTYNTNSEVLSLAVDSLGRLLIGGRFTSIGAGNGENANRLHVARLIDSEQAENTRFDFDGDGRADLGTFDDTNGVWNIFNSETSQASATQFGLTNDKTAPADFDGDGKTDIAVYRPSEGNWYLNQTGGGFSLVRWGIAEDIPMPADYDGDGKADIAVWRPSTGVWYILRSSDNQPQIIQFGLTEDIPLRSADFDGDGKTDIAVWRPSDGNFYWLESGSNNSFKVVHFGQNGDIPTTGDFNGDGKTDLVVFRPTQGIWYQYLTSETGEYSFSAIQFGLNGDEPIAADYDGDGKTDIAIRRQNVWHLMLSGSGHSFLAFGDVNTRAIASLPIY